MRKINLKNNFKSNLKIKSGKEGKLNFKKNKFPKFYSGRIALIALVLFFLLTSSIYSNIFLKAIISTLGEEKLENIRERNLSSTNQSEPIQFIFQMAFSNFRVLIIFILIFIIIGLPYKIYFNNKKKNKQIKSRLENYVKKTIVRTPHIFSTIFFLVSIISQIIVFNRIKASAIYFSDMKIFIIDIRIISTISSLVTSIFIFSWQKYRLQKYYMVIVFSNEELHFFPVKTHFSSIKFNFLIGFLVTGFLPLIYVFFSIFLNLSYLNDIKIITQEQNQIIFGGFSKFILINRFNDLNFYEVLNKLYKELPFLFVYYSTFDTIMMYISFISGLLASFIYIVTFLKFNTQSLINPINRLLKSMEKVEEHDFDAFTYVESTDEIGQMVVGFNRMLTGLQEKEKIRDLFGLYLTKQISEKILKSEINLDGEMFEATILFSDIRDFTSITSDISPVEIVQFLNEYFDKMIEVAVKYDGIIDKFIGDGMLVVFGIPFKIKDHSDKALQASIEMQNVVDNWNKSRIEAGKFPVKIGIGLHSGQIIAGNIGNKRKLQYTVVGDTVNVASRIESLNKSLSTRILMSKYTYDNLNLNLFSKDKFTIHKDVEIRGKSEKFDLYSYE